MKKPNNTVEMFVMAIIAFGGVLLVIGMLNFNGIWGGGNPEVVLVGRQYISFGVIFIAVGIIAMLSQQLKSARLEKLDKNGEKVQGKITDVEFMQRTRWGKHRPFIVKYSFEFNGKTKTAQTDFYWETPPFKKGESVTVIVSKNGTTSKIVEQGEALQVKF